MSNLYNISSVFVSRFRKIVDVECACSWYYCSYMYIVYSVLLAERFLPIVSDIKPHYSADATNTHLFEEGRREVATLDGNVAQQALLIGFLENILLDRILTNQTIDVHVTCLPDTVTPVLRLRVHRRVPV